eukprot:366199-Chlamydomonas_euryale.AAC.9
MTWPPMSNRKPAGRVHQRGCVREGQGQHGERPSCTSPYTEATCCKRAGRANPTLARHECLHVACLAVSQQASQHVAVHM